MSKLLENQAFSAVDKTRTREALVESVGKALDVVSTNDARGFFVHCGYRTLA
jgi:hypothetical protein